MTVFIRTNINNQNFLMSPYSPQYIAQKTILRNIITHCTEIKKLTSCDPYGRKCGFKTVAFLLHLSILSAAAYLFQKIL